MISLGPPPSTCTGSRVVASIPFVGEIGTALPFGRRALSLLGGTVTVSKEVKKSKNQFDESKIVIPVGVTPQNLANYNLYAMLGFSPEWADSCDQVAIKKAYSKAVLMYHPDKVRRGM